VYLEPDATIGNFEIRITTFIVTTCPLQFTPCADIRFLWHHLWIQLSLLLPVIQFWVIHFKTLPYTKSSITFSAVHCSAFLHSFSGLAFVSLCTHTHTHTPTHAAHARAHTHTHARTTCALRFPLQSSMCHWNSIYKLWAGLLVWPSAPIFHMTLASNPSVTFVENFQWHFFLAWFGCPLAAFASMLFS
jgi:hypothetical protein